MGIQEKHQGERAAPTFLTIETNILDTMASSELVWQCIKGGNSFMRKGLNNTYFSAEPGNLTGKHSYKFSAIANKKTVDLVTDGTTIVLTKASKKVMKGVSKEITGYRTDLADIAVRRASSL